jgi:hypothetical protein
MFLLLASVVFAEDRQSPEPNPYKPQGWSFDIGGAYTWMSLSTPPTYKGSTGGVLAKITYQQPYAFYGQARSIYNLGRLSKNRLHESYTEFVGGYSAAPLENWMITPYLGLGLDFLSDRRTGHSPIHLNYTLYYAIVGFETHYAWRHWMLGLQVDCFPMFNQYLRVKGLPHAAWVLKNRTGAAVHLPVAYRYFKNFWLEFTPYYRFLPIGASHTLHLPKRNLNQWGAFVAFRFFL